MNAAAVALLAIACGVPAEVVSHALPAYRGLRPRFEVRRVGDVTIVDDYAHLPTALASTFETVRATFAGRRLVVISWPHQTSRTASLLDEFARSLQNVHALAITTIHRAREALADAAQVTAATLARRVEQLGQPVGPEHEL